MPLTPTSSPPAHPLPRTPERVRERLALLCRLRERLRLHQVDVITPHFLLSKTEMEIAQLESLLKLWGDAPRKPRLSARPSPPPDSLPALADARRRDTLALFAKAFREAAAAAPAPLQTVTLPAPPPGVNPPVAPEDVDAALAPDGPGLNGLAPRPLLFDFPRRRLRFTPRHIRGLTEWIRLHNIAPRDICALLTLPSPLCLLKACYAPELVRNCQEPGDWVFGPQKGAQAREKVSLPPGVNPPRASGPGPTITITFRPIVPVPPSYLTYTCNAAQCPPIAQQELDFVKHIQYFETTDLLKSLAECEDMEYAKRQYTGFIKLQQGAIALYMSKLYKLPNKPH